MSVYFDHNATTPLHPDVFRAMQPWLTGRFGNASSLYRAGREARDAVEAARAEVAALVNAAPEQVIFTSGGTESDNLAIGGMAAAHRPGRGLISAIEHPAVAEAARAAAECGWPVETVSVDRAGRIDLADLSRRLAGGGVAWVSIMAANNETGVIQDVAAIAAMVRVAGAWLHTDAVQAPGKFVFDFAASGAHCASLSAHKIGGPQGVGALVLDKHLPITPTVHGGGQEQGLRAGTYNVAGIVGFGAAAARLRMHGDAEIAHMRALRERLEAGLDALPGVTRFAADAQRLVNTSQFALAGYHGEGLLMLLDREDIAVSSGSACAAGSGEPSPVLLAMGVEPDLAHGAIRVSLGPENTAEEVDRFLAVLAGLASGGMPHGMSAAVLGG